MLLRITVYDLRVFGFELCDVYKPMIRISIDLIADEVMPGNICYDMCKALSDFTTLVSIPDNIMHLSKYCPTYPPTGKRWGFDLILTAKHAPDQGDLINIYK